MGNLTTLIILITIIAHLPAIVMAIIGAALFKTKPETSKILFILAAVYTVAGLGICGTLLNK